MDTSNLPEPEFIKMFHLEKSQLRTLIGELTPYLTSQDGPPEVTRRINMTHIQSPMLPQDRISIKDKFYQEFEMPGVLGCIDGTQAPIIRYVHHGEMFFNRKGYHSLNVMIDEDQLGENLGLNVDSAESHQDPERQRIWTLQQILVKRIYMERLQPLSFLHVLLKRICILKKG